MGKTTKYKAFTVIVRLLLISSSELKIGLEFAVLYINPCPFVPLRGDKSEYVNPYIPTQTLEEY